MSHLADLKLRITDLDAADIAAKAFGGELVRGQTTYRWYGRWMNDWHNSERAAALHGHDPKTFGHCAHVIRIPGAQYDIGLVPALDGVGYDLIYDAYCGGRGLEDALGVGLVKFENEYATVIAMRNLIRKGYTVTRQNLPNDRVKVIALKR